MALNRLSLNREQLGNRAVCAFMDERLFFFHFRHFEHLTSFISQTDHIASRDII